MTKTKGRIVCTLCPTCVQSIKDSAFNDVQLCRACKPKLYQTLRIMLSGMSGALELDYDVPEHG